MPFRSESVAITTDASGDFVGRTGLISGRLVKFIYTNTDFDAGVDVTITTANTSQTVLTLTDANSSASYRPVETLDNETGGALTDGTYDYFPAAGEQVVVTVAQGGNAKTGSVEVVWEGHQ